MSDEAKTMMEKFPNLREFFPFLDLYNKESARGSVLIASSYVEEQLRRILLGFLIEGDTTNKLIDDAYAPLGSFSARTAICFSMGLIAKDEFQSCTLIRKIRNEFAHTVQATFDDDRIRDLCRRLPFRIVDHDGEKVGAAAAFGTGALGLIMKLTNRAEYVSRMRLSHIDWPF